MKSIHASPAGASTDNDALPSAKIPNVMCCGGSGTPNLCSTIDNTHTDKGDGVDQALCQKGISRDAIEAYRRTDACSFSCEQPEQYQIDDCGYSSVCGDEL